MRKSGQQSILTSLRLSVTPRSTICKLAIVQLMILAASAFFCGESHAAEDLNSALRRAQYLLNGTTPTDDDYNRAAASRDAYQNEVRSLINNDNFYDVMMRYHERVFGVGLQNNYIEELLIGDEDTQKFARISCERQTGPNGRFRCQWASTDDESEGGCPEAWEQAASVFWYPGVIAWACPSILNACGHDLSNCFIEYVNEDEARNSELGTTEVFDSRFAVVESLSNQASGIATAVVIENYPYTRILEPGLTAVDGAVAHFYRQPHHFKVASLGVNPKVLKFAKDLDLTDTRFKLVSSGYDYASGGILTTFGWLRRYDKNRTRANMLYERLLCKQFTSELPAVFPQDPGDLRTAPGCQDCHSVLDPLADFFKAWGEEGSLYVGGSTAVNTYFSAAECTGSSIADLAQCIQRNRGFATCQVNHVWEWLIGRQFHVEEESLRTALTDYFIGTTYSMKELIYAVATHPAFTEGTRGDGEVSEALREPALGTITTTSEATCDADSYDFATDIKPTGDRLCLGCHNGSGTTLSLVTESDWNAWGTAAVTSMNLRNMPRGSPDWSEVQSFANTVRCWKEQ